MNNRNLIINKNFFSNDLYNRVVFSSDNFIVIPSLGALVEGWLLVVPKKHYISFGAINNPKLYVELNFLIQSVAEILKKEYNNDVVIFENGACDPQKLVGCGVDYAHLHIVPMSIDLIHRAELYFGKKYNWKNIDSIDVVRNYYNEGLPYLFLKDNHGSMYITTDENIPSQLFRKVIAHDLGVLDKFNWKENFFLDNIKKTITRLSKYLEINHEKILT